MKKNNNHLLAFIICFVAAGLLGVIIGTIKYFGTERSATNVSATVTLSYDGISEGLAPNGERFDINSFYSEDLMGQALTQCGMDSRYEAAEVLGALTIRGSYSKDIVDKILSYESLLDFTANKEMSVSTVYPTSFGFTLSDSFDTDISEEDLTAILNALLKVYDEYFADTYLYAFDTKGMSGITALTDYDFEQQLQLLTYDLQLVSSYAQQMYEKAPAFRYNGIGFNDIYVQNNALESNLISRIEALTTMNAYSKVPGRMYIQYVYQLNSLTNELTERESNLASLDDLIAAYDKYEIIYVAAGNGLTKLDGNSSETYDLLVDMRVELADEITQLKSDISSYEQRLNDLRASLGYDAENLEIISILEDIGQQLAENAGQTNGAEDGSELSDSTSGTATGSGSTTGTASGSTASGSTADSSVTTTITYRKWTLVNGWESIEVDDAAIALIEEQIDELIASRVQVNEQFKALLAAYNETFLSGVSFAGATVRYNAPRLISGGYIVTLIKCCGPFCLLVVIAWTGLCFVQSMRRREEM